MGGRFALLIGTGSFRDGSLPQLDAPPADVRDLAVLLRDPYIAGFDPVIELVNSSTQQVGREIAHILDRRHRDDLVLLYYSGHALFDDEGQLHLAMHDTELDLLSPTSISAAFIASEMDRSRSRRQLLVLDCRVGTGLAHGTQGGPIISSSSSGNHVIAPVPDAQRLANAFHTEARGRVIFAGCEDPGRKSTVPGFRRSQVPGDPMDPSNSAFTYALIEGLRGAGDLDRDGRITIDELYEYAHSQLAQSTTNLLPCKRGEASTGVPIAYATRRPSVVPPVHAAGRTSRPPGPGALISDRYLTHAVLEEGGLGIVFAARDERSGKPVSIRILRPPASMDAGTLERFLREAQVASTIDHPNVVRIYELGFEGRSAFIAMEPLDGESLAALLKRKTRLALTEALEILLPAMTGVSAAHAQNVLHRDLRPENIFVNRDASGAVASVKVLGFGMSAVLDQHAAAAAGSGMIRSPHYVPPEQLLEKQQADVRSDVYAFGAILYEMLTGSRPFSAENHAAVLFRIGDGVVDAPSAVCPELPAALDEIVGKAMAKDRAGRYADVEKLRRALQDAARESGWTATFDSMPPPRQSSRAPANREVKIETPAVFERPLPKESGPRSRGWLLGVTLLAAAGGAAGWLLSGSFSDEPPRAPTAASQLNEVHPAPVLQPALPAAGANALPESGSAGEEANANANANAEIHAAEKPTETPTAPSPTPVPESKPETASEQKPDDAKENAKAAQAATQHKPMPANLAAFLADAGVPIDSVTPIEARRMLIRARTEARAAARAGARKSHETRANDEPASPAPIPPPAAPATPAAPAPNDAPLEIKPLPDHPNAANGTATP
jgi:serine/threonine protein kinase